MAAAVCEDVNPLRQMVDCTGYRCKLCAKTIGPQSLVRTDGRLIGPEPLP